MKTLNSSLLRIIFSFVLGLVLVIWPDAAFSYLIITIGVLFLIPGLVGLTGYLLSKQQERGRFPLESVGSILFGVWLIVMPDFFANLLMYLLGFVLILGGINQIYSVFIARKWTHVPFGFYILPALILLTGIVIVINPVEVRQTTFLIIGIATLLYAIAELITWLRFTRRREEALKNIRSIEAEDVTIIEE